MGLLDNVKFNYTFWLNNRSMVAFPAKLVAAASLMSFWIPETQINPGVWISVFATLVIAFNMFNVRRYGEIEFWMTTIKVETLVLIFLMGILLPMDASSATRLTGTDSQYRLIPCSDPVTDNC